MYTVLILCSVPAVYSIIVRDPPPSPTDYKYAYEIEDPTTGDSKSQHEVRQGDMVSGAYSVVGPDGTKRIVEYTADSKHGYQAVLREEPTEEPTQAMKEQIPYVIKLKPYKNPLLYTLIDPKLAFPYTKENDDVVYFTPENEIDTPKIRFEVGKYFEPAK